uniref:Transposase (putative) gypsy type domain-containing protein n=1 Tax=Tanacetum cinerariifolium TaxID=118510 RepID=A0A6L2JU90_TANCI|nr:hypothetical protein [Tanacetum cinerariifolium]
MYKRPAGKIGLYTRFFDFANFRLPLSTFFVDVLRHFRINISQLSVIGAAKVSHFKILCRVYGIIPTVGVFRYFYVNSKKIGWMSFSKRSDNASHVIRDPAPLVVDFNKPVYATLIAHPSLFWKFLKAFLYLVRLSHHYTLDEETYPYFLYKNREDIVAFIHTPDLTKVKIAERERNEGEPLLLEATISRTVLLLLVAPDRAESELDASVERLFNEGDSGNQTEQVDFIDGGKDVDIQLVIKAADIVVEDVAPMQPKRQGKRKSVVVDADGASHPPKKLKEDYGTPSGTFVSGKYRSVLKRLLAGAVLNAEVRVAAMPTLPFMTSSISFTPERKGEDHTDSTTGPNLRVIGAPPRSFIPIMTTVATITFMVDPALVAKKKLVKPFSFCADSSLAGGTDPTTGVFSDITGTFTEFNVGAAYQMSLSAMVRMRVEYNVKENRRLKVVAERQVKLLKVKEGEIENLKAWLFFREAEAAEAIRLHAQASIFKAVEKFLWDKTDALKERNTILENERNALDVKVTKLEASTVSKERKLTDLNVLVTSIKSQNNILVDWISSFGLQEKVTVYESCMDQLEKFQDDRMKVINEKFDKLYNDFVEMALHLEEKFYPHLLTTVSGRRWFLTHGMELAIIKCLNSPEYLSTLGAAIGKAIKKGMQDGLSARIVHGKEGRALTYVAAYNPSAEDASVEAVMNILHLEGPLAEKLGLNELFRVRRIRENIANQRSALRDVFVPLAEPFSAAALTGTEGTFDIAHATADTNTALSTTFASASSIDPISVDDYEVVGAEDQAVADENAASFPNVDDVELNITG